MSATFWPHPSEWNEFVAEKHEFRIHGMKPRDPYMQQAWQFGR